MNQKTTAKVVVLNKDMAQKLLDRVNPDLQRKLSEFTVEKYVSDMDSNDWVEGSNVIAQDRKGFLINGQHVLTAFIRSTLVRLEVILSVNTNPNAIYGYDHNRRRTLGDDLKHEGVEKFNAVASVAVIIYQHERGFYDGLGYLTAGSGQHYPSSPKIRKIVRMHPGIEGHLFPLPPDFRGRGISIAVLRAASYEFTQEDEKNAKKFFKSFLEGTGIPSTQHPIHVLRDALLGRPMDHRGRPGIIAAWTRKAWYAYLSGNDLPKPIMGKKEPFPVSMPPIPDSPKAPRSVQ